jgi:hypothetical protein
MTRAANMKVTLKWRIWQEKETRTVTSNGNATAIAKRGLPGRRRAKEEDNLLEC